MTTDPQVTHPPVTHPETITPAGPTTPPEGAAKRAVRTPAARSVRPAWRMPPPKVTAAVVLVAVALELLLWQVAGPLWGLVAHAILAVVALVAVVVLARRHRAQQRALLTAARTLRRIAAPMGQVTGKSARGPLGRLFRRSGRSTTGAAGKRGGLFGARSGGAGRGLFGRRSGAGGSSRGGLLGKLTGGRRRTGSAGRAATGGGRAASGRAGGLLGRLGRKSASRSAAGGTSRRRAGVGAALGRMRSGGRSLIGRSRPASTSTARKGSPGRSAKRAFGGLFGQKTTKPSGSKTSPLAGFMRGVREGVKSKPATKQPPQPKHQAEAKPAAPAKAETEKPQQPTKEQLVKEAVQRVADATPAPVSSRRTRGTAVGSMRDILAAAEDLAGQMKAYDEEDMHVFVRELPQLGEALSAIEGGIKMMASRAESEWPLAAPVVEALGSVAGDVRSAAGTVGEAKTTVHRENETDIERGEAPRQGERRWNV